MSQVLPAAGSVLQRSVAAPGSQPQPQPQPQSPEDDDRKVRRREKNRVAAQRSRKKQTQKADKLHESPELAASRTRHVLRDDRLLVAFGAKRNSPRKVTARKDNTQPGFSVPWKKRDPDPGGPQSLCFSQVPRDASC